MSVFINLLSIIWWINKKNNCPEVGYCGQPLNWALDLSSSAGLLGTELSVNEGSWPKMWMTGSLLTSWMIFCYPKESTLKVLCLYLNCKCVKKRGTLRTLQIPEWRNGWKGHCWHHWWFSFTQRMVPWMFLVNISIIGWDIGYKENRPIVIMPTQPKLTQAPRVIHGILNLVAWPQGSYAKHAEI